MEAHSNTFTIRVDQSVKRKLEALAKDTGRSRSYLAAEAIAEYLAANEWQIAGINRAFASIDRGNFVEHQAVADWVESWDGDHELPAPKPWRL